MKVLVGTLNSKFIHSSPAVAYLSAAAEKRAAELDSKGKKGFKIERAEFTINNSDDYIYNEIAAAGYDAVCFACYIWNIEKTLHICENLKKAFPKMVIVLGGPEVSYDAEELLKAKPFVDVVIRGEGEKVLPDFLEALAAKNDKAVKNEATNDNIGCRIIDGGCVTPEDVPNALNKADDLKILYYETTRGCPYNCSYCMSSIDKKIRAFPMERVKKELSKIIDAEPRQVKFLDRTFNWSAERSEEILSFIMENDNGTTNFHFEICAEILTEKLIKLIAGARKNLFRFEVGIQSTNPKTLEAVGRSANIDKVLDNTSKLVAAVNCPVHVDLIAGLPYEDMESFKKSFNEVYGLGADELQLGFLKLLKGTVIRAEADKYGYVFDSKAPYQVIKNDFMGPDDMVRLKRIEHVLDDFYNKGGFNRGLAAGIASFKTAFDFYDCFAEFYFREGYQRSSHKKEDNYRILARFAKEETDCRENIKEALYNDLTERMNPEAVKRFDKKGWEI